MASEPQKTPAEYVTIKVTSDIPDRLRALQHEFSHKTGGGTITQSALLSKGLDCLEAAGTLTDKSAA